MLIKNNEQHFVGFMTPLSVSDVKSSWHHEDFAVVFIFVISHLILKLLFYHYSFKQAIKMVNFMNYYIYCQAQ